MRKEAWIRAMSLDPDTGLDPPGSKVRAAQGLDAAAYFLQGYWRVDLAFSGRVHMLKSKLFSQDLAEGHRKYALPSRVLLARL